MSYSNNPYLPKARMRARNDVVWGRLTITQASNKYGVHRTTVWRWIKKAEKLGLNGNSFIWTESSAPHHHPNELDTKIVDRIIELRKTLNRCAPIIHEHLKREGIHVAISTVGKVLRKHKLTRKKKQLKDYKPFPRPKIKGLGSLVQMDTIHIVRNDYSRLYIYTVIDVFSRFAYAEYRKHISNKASFEIIKKTQKYFGFKFDMVQTDNGAEFSPAFGSRLANINIKHRYSRVRKPNDNSHIERFNRTIQEEGLRGNLKDEKIIKNKINKFINHYNFKRLHLGINCQTPSEYVAKVSN